MLVVNESIDRRIIVAVAVVGVVVALLGLGADGMADFFDESLGSVMYVVSLE